MAGKKNNATSSWSGYNHQGQVGIFLALKELNELLQKKELNELLQKYEYFSKYSVEFEKEDGEDIDIICNNKIMSRHQVKAKTSGKVPSSYRDVLISFKNKGVPKNSMYLHTICKIDGFEEYKEKKKDEGLQIHNVKLYQYPDGNNYCRLSNVSESKIDSFCKWEIKSILIQCSPRLKDDDDHINETLFVLKDLLCKKIREAHEAGKCSNPVILFSEIYDILISTEKREKRAIHTARNMFERYWNHNSNAQNIDDSLITDILNLPDKGFQQFLIDLHPQKDIKGALDNQTIFELLDQDIFEEIFYEFYKEIHQDFFNIPELCYNSTKSRYRLSLINKTCKNGEVGELVQRIRNNEQFLKASFDVDYLVNGRINSSLFEQGELDDGLESPYGQQPSNKDNLFSNNLEFIDIDNTVEKLRGEQYE